MGKRVQKRILKEDIIKANEPIEIGTVSLVIKVMPIKTSRQDHHTSIRMGQWKDEKISRVAENINQCVPCYWVLTW